MSTSASNGLLGQRRPTGSCKVTLTLKARKGHGASRPQNAPDLHKLAPPPSNPSLLRPDQSPATLSKVYSLALMP